ncbi:hypothetical protein [Chryseobacterium aquifrigidense]|uniref:Uncharacterized protein n=1 Tax=Chryseobacterium aquifrigidense TaxID=558021 RepID=A0A543E9N9_9FLAO|nr:hypothetical protein [Chryseobacterium aquifrigidense]TQM18310.1 hypothetical protein FB551_4091 [Chryseobacterium aquifrigidense]
MNKEELLKIYSAYLPYGLQISTDDEGEDWVETVIGVNNEALETSVGNYWDFTVKPILYDLSYLTKEIEHEGEKFVPSERLMNYASNFGVHRGVFEHMLSSILDGNTLVTELPYYLIIKLLEWHLNVFQLQEDQFINKATLTK